MAAANSMCKIWLVIKSTISPENKRDMVHSVSILKTKAQLDAVNAEKEEAEYDDEFMSVDIREYTIKKDQDTVHVVFHYHDNYSDYAQIFESYETARTFYKSEISKMDEDLDDDYYIKMQKYPDGGYMATLYDEEDSYPDKGSRWVLTTLHIQSCAAAAAVGGGVRRRCRTAAKTRKAAAKRR